MMSDYLKTWRMVERIRGLGMSVYAVCIAYELDEEIKDALRRLRYSKIVRRKFDEDEEKLFDIAMKGLSRTYGASTPKDVVAAVVEAYLDGGFDLVHAEEMLGDVKFVLKIAGRESSVRENERKTDNDCSGMILQPLGKVSRM